MSTQREHFGTKLGFILAAAGSAIGLGTLWKFPYVTGANGGGLFVLIYLGCTFLIGIPLFIGELLLGRKAQRGAVGIFSEISGENTPWRAVGWLGVASSFLILSYYITVAGWGLNYLLMSLNQFYLDRSSTEITQVFNTLYTSGDITSFWALLFLLITFGVVFQGIRKGIEKWSKIFTSALFILLLLLFGYAMTLSGFKEAVHFVFAPNVSALKPSGILEALGLSFFTLSLGQGILLTYGSYLTEKDDIPKTALIIGSMVIIVSMLAALTIFPVIFTFGLPPEGGEGLVFKTLPVLFAKLPGAMLLSTTFFALFVFTALTSAVALLEVVAANFIDLLHWSRKKAVIVSSIAAFVVGIPSALAGSGAVFPDWLAMFGLNFFASIDQLVSVWLLPLGGLFLALYVGWRLDKKSVMQEFKQHTSLGVLFTLWFFLVRYVAPAAIFLIFVQKGGFINLDKLFQ